MITEYLAFFFAEIFSFTTLVTKDFGALSAKPNKQQRRMFVVLKFAMGDLSCKPIPETNLFFLATFFFLLYNLGEVI